MSLKNRKQGFYNLNVNFNLCLKVLTCSSFLSYCFSRFYFKVINPFNSIFFSITHIERKEGFWLSFHLPHTFLYLWVWRLLITVTYFYVTHPGRLKLKLKITVPRFYVIHFECFNSTWRAKNTFHLFYVIAGRRGSIQQQLSFLMLRLQPKTSSENFCNGFFIGFRKLIHNSFYFNCLAKIQTKSILILDQIFFLNSVLFNYLFWG